MNKTIVAGLCLWGMSSVVFPAFAADSDPQQCLECHEPIEDWAGLTPEQIIEQARNPENKRHKANMALTDEQLKLIIGVLIPPK